MKKQFTTIGVALLSMMAIVLSCSNEDVQSLVEQTMVVEENSKESLNFYAEYSPQQMENLSETGFVFFPEQQKDSWSNIVPNDIPTYWGLFDSPLRPGLRSAGIWGSYPAQYWTMIRLKTALLSPRMRKAVNRAVNIMESQTNVRFYNSQFDPDYHEQYNFRLPNVYVRYSASDQEGSGSFGLVGGEQYINIPRELDNEEKYTDEEVYAFLLHAFCNAAGMFNEQQRKDRDDYVDIHWGNIKNACHFYFDKQDKNYTMSGYFDYNSITLASSKAFSKNGSNTITKKGGGAIAKNLTLSPMDISFLNSHYLPYIARTDLYTELDTVVYFQDRKLSDVERIELQRRINERRGLYGDPPADARIKRKPW